VSLPNLNTFSPKNPSQEITKNFFPTFAKDASIVVVGSGETKNAFVLGGGSGHGFKHTPALGKLIAAVLSGKEKIPSLFLLSSERK